MFFNCSSPPSADNEKGPFTWFGHERDKAKRKNHAPDNPPSKATIAMLEFDSQKIEFGTIAKSET